MLFLPARVDTTDGEKQQEWLDRARNQLAGLGEFPNGLLIPYDRTYAYGELLVAPEDAADWPIVQSYRRVASTILEEELAEIDVEVDSFPRRRAQLARVRTLQQHWKELQERLAAGPDPDDVAHVLGELRQMQQELAGITAGLETGVLQRWDGWSGGASPGTLRECTIFSERLEAAIQRADRARLHHLESEQEKIEAEVGALEDRDRQELERIVDLVDPAEREHRLQTFHEDLRRSRIDVKIRSGALCREDVEGLYADRADGVLDQHLDVALERNEEPTALLAILKLRAPGLEDVAPRHWNAWSKVWKLDGAFAAVGEQLWLAAWRQALRTGTAVGDGEEERLALLELPDTEMQRLAASLAAALDTAEVAELLRLRPILASRTDDLLLTEAVQRMPSGRRRARLAAWIALDQREESLKGVALEDWAAAGGAADVATCLSDLPAKIAAPVALALFRVGEFSAFQQFVRRNSAAVAEILARKDTDVLSLLALCTPDLLQHEARQHYDWVKKELGPPPWVRTGDLEVERLYQHLEDLLKKKFAGSWKGWGSRWDEAIQQWWRDHLGALVDGGERPPTTSQLTVELESADPPLAKNPPEGGLLTAFRSLHEDRLEALDGWNWEQRVDEAL
ncbi:MAG TPA: hypothetical protein PKY30_12820, partial [Myxococcota bacterium]|nr:hypothetical protein [Myxococcota bacterium]